MSKGHSIEMKPLTVEERSLIIVALMRLRAFDKDLSKERFEEIGRLIDKVKGD